MVLLATIGVRKFAFSFSQVYTAFLLVPYVSNPPKGNGFPLVREIKGVMCVDIRKLGAEPTPADIASVEQLLNKYEFVLFFSNRSKAKFGPDVWSNIEKAYLNKNFPAYYSTKLESPLTKYPMCGNEMEQHVVLSKKENISQEEHYDNDKILDVLLQLAYERISTKAQNQWTILGDERGTPGKETHGKFIHAWVVVPPNTPLQILNKEFHCTDNPKDLPMALDELNKYPNIQCHVFEEHGNSKPPTNVGVSGLAHYDFWQSTLPLVIEKITQLDKNAKIGVFVEQVGMIKPGKVRFDLMVNQVKETIQSIRKEWLGVSIDFNCVGKGDHPWHGYSDAVPYAIRTPLVEHRDKYAFLPKKDEILPFRRASLLTSVHDLHKRSHQPLEFLKFLISMEQNDLQDYARTFFDHIIAKHTASLGNDEWLSLGREVRRCNDANSQAAVRLILEFANFEEIWNRFNESQNLEIKFELAMYGLAASNHSGDYAKSELFAETIEDGLADANGAIDPKRIDQYHILRWGGLRNSFQFEKAIQLIHEFGIHEMNTDHQHDEFWMKGCSELMQNYAYLGTEEAMKKALQLSDQIRNVYRGFPDDNHSTRHALYAAEIRFGLEQINEAKTILDGIKEDGRDAYFVAAMAKLVALSSKNSKEVEGLKIQCNKLFQYNWNKGHPNERILYWNAIASLKNNDDEHAANCANLLAQCAQESDKMRDAFGVIVACKLKDLSQRMEIPGFTDQELQNLFTLVHEQSNENTKAWFTDNATGLENPIKALHFNYH